MESMGKKKARPRRSFTSEFKAEIVELCRRGDRSVGQVAKDFDLTETAVRDWVKQAEIDAGERNGLTSALLPPCARLPSPPIASSMRTASGPPPAVECKRRQSLRQTSTSEARSGLTFDGGREGEPGATVLGAAAPALNSSTPSHPTPLPYASILYLVINIWAPRFGPPAGRDQPRREVWVVAASRFRISTTLMPVRSAIRATGSPARYALTIAAVRPRRAAWTASCAACSAAPPSPACSPRSSYRSSCQQARQAGTVGKIHQQVRGAAAWQARRW